MQKTREILAVFILESRLKFETELGNRSNFATVKIIVLTSNFERLTSE